MATKKSKCLTENRVRVIVDWERDLPVDPDLITVIASPAKGKPTQAEARHLLQCANCKRAIEDCRETFARLHEAHEIIDAHG